MRSLPVLLLVVAGCAAPAAAPRTAAPNPGGCSRVETAIKTWQIVQKTYDDLLPTALAQSWTAAQYHAAVTERVNQILPGGGVDSTGPSMSTDPCTCQEKNVKETCDSYAQRGLPPILCDVSKAHEDAHVRQCQDNAALPAGDPGKYTCDAAGKAHIPPKILDHDEHEAYGVNLGMLQDWFSGNKCPHSDVPVVPSRHPIAACTLLGAGEAEAALGRSLTAESPKQDRSGLYSVCTYFGEPNTAQYRVDVVSVAVSVRQGPIDRADFDKDIQAHAAQLGGATALAGIGDSAFAVGATGDAGFAAILVLRGDVEFGVQVYFQHKDGAPFAAARDLAAAIAGRLPVGLLNARR